MLCHPGATHLENTIQQHFTWVTLTVNVRTMCKKFPTYEIKKCALAKYGHLPVMKNKSQQWDTLCVDMIGPYTITQRGVDANRNKKKI